MTVGLAAALFLLFFVFLRSLLLIGWGRADRRRRLQARRQPAWSVLAERLLVRFDKPYRHVTDLLAAAGWRTGTPAFAVLSFLLALAGAAAGIALFRSAQSALLLTAMLALIPYCSLRFRLLNRQMASRLEFLPALEWFYQCYLVTGRRQIRTALQRAVEERRLSGEIQAVFDELYRHLSVKGDDASSLRRFALAVGHIWADYFANMLGVALAEGNDISANLQELIQDMRKSRMDEQAERHRLLEIRLANFSPILFLGIFLTVNFRMSPEDSFRYYVTDPVGRGMLLNAAALIFLSLLMGLYLSRRKL